MSETLVYKDTVNRVGYTQIDGVKVVQHVCTIEKDNPEKMNISRSILDKTLYKENRETCRADIAEFEDLAYELQDEYTAAWDAKREDAE